MKHQMSSKFSGGFSPLHKFAGVCTALVVACAAIPHALGDDAGSVPEPQLVKDAWMLLVGYEADGAALRELLPPGLEADPGSMVVMNMYTVPEGSETSGLGAYTLTYLAVQLKGQDGYIAGTPNGIPGRYVAYYWNSSDSMRIYTRRSGFPDNPGGSTTLLKESGTVTTTLTVNGQAFIEATAQISGDPQAPYGGHINYFGAKNGQAVRFPLPYICSNVKTENPSVTFKVPSNHPAAKLKPKKIVWAALARCSIVYPQAVAHK
jgi:Acetoacetate decarboxylase (ADC)